MAVNVPTSIASIVSGRVRPNRFGALGSRRLGIGDTIRARELVRPVALLHLARSAIPRGWSWYHPTGIGTTSASYAEIAQTITTLAPATSTTFDVVARTSGSGSVRVTITDGSSSDNVVLSSSGSEATRTGTLDVSSFIANAPCVVTLDALASSGTVTVFGVALTPQRLTASDIA